MACCARWRSWIRQLFLTIYSVILVIAIVLIAIDLDQNKAETRIYGWFVGGLFVLFSLPISIWGILQHLVHYTNPSLQRREIRIMWMVPIYASNAWMALRFPRAAIYLDTLRECYEAYVIYNFMMYLLTYLWDSKPFLEREMQSRPPIKLDAPLCCLKRWDGGKFLQRCKHGVLQYTIVRPFTTIIALICELAGAYHEGEFQADGAWTYLVIINSISQTWALYCLVMFYRVMKEDLKPMKPLKKFLCVKFVIFLSFWQSIVIAILVAVGIIKQQADWVLYDTKKAAAGIQDFAICIEMFFAAIAHYFSFSHHAYIDANNTETNGIAAFFASMRHMFKIDDVTDDVRDHVRTVGKAASRTLTSGIGLSTSSYGSRAESEPLIRFSKDTDDEEESVGVSFDYKTPVRPNDSDSLQNLVEFSLSSENDEVTTNETGKQSDNEGAVNNSKDKDNATTEGENKGGGDD